MHRSLDPRSKTWVPVPPAGRAYCAPYSGAGSGAAYPDIIHGSGTVGPEVGANGCTYGLRFSCSCALRFGFGVDVEGSPVRSLERLFPH